MILKEKTTSSNSENPKIKSALLDKYKEDHQKEVDGYERLKTKESNKLPKPTGWRLVVLPFRPPKRTKSGLYLAEKAVEKQQVATVCGYVLETGPLAYYDQEKFPHGAWCKKGDWVVFARYAGARINIEDGEIRILNDDEILATIKDPEDVIHMV